LSTAENPNGLNYHLLLTHAGTRAEFDQWVASEGTTMTQGEWRGLALNPDQISAVEADARLARWSQATSGFALRFTRTNDSRWWMAVHHDGQRLFAMVHHFGPSEDLRPIPSVVGNAGRDPLLDIVGAGKSSIKGVQQEVAQQRAEQFRDALREGGIDCELDALIEAINRDGDGTGGIPAILQVLGAADFCGLLNNRRTTPAPEPPPYDVRKLAKQGLVGCAVPIAAGIVTFFIAIQVFVRVRLPGLVALILAVFVSSAATRLSRRVYALWMSGRRSERYLRMDWAAKGKPNTPKNPLGLGTSKILNVPLSAALNTWGGLFYLLRDIGFFGGVARPESKTLNHTEAWAMGPPKLISVMNQVALGQLKPDRMFQAASQLVEMRRSLIQSHIEGTEPDPMKVRDKVHEILSPVVGQ